MQLVESVRDLGQHGPFKPPAEHGLDEVGGVWGCVVHHGMNAHENKRPRANAVELYYSRGE